MSIKQLNQSKRLVREIDKNIILVCKNEMMIHHNIAEAEECRVMDCIMDFSGHVTCHRE